MNQLPRPEHPRPDRVRNTFLNLNGAWEFAFDDADRGLAEGWYRPETRLGGSITVPFAYQSAMSGVGPTDELHPLLWYRRAFRLTEEFAGKRVLLHFGAVDERADVYVNGQHIAHHEGGYTPFTVDVTHALAEGENDLCVRVADAPDCTQPRGKQYWQTGLMGCWYTPVSGIWQTVWMEAVGDMAMESIHITPDIDQHLFRAEITLDAIPKEEMRLELAVSFDHQPIRTLSVTTRDRVTTVPVDLNARGATGNLDPIHLWGPDHPDLYDLRVRLISANGVEDDIRTYFGMRKIELRSGKVYLNNCPLYQRLVLDQGYWPESLLTPPSDEAIRQDIQFTLDFGYNGARKHQKIEDPRYYYWADKMGLLVWGEVPSAYDFNDSMARKLTDTTAAFIDRDFNHPCIITWVPINESWGLRQIFTDKRQQAMSNALYHLVKAMDGTRLCSGNDGWEQTSTDICALHDYAGDADTMAAHFADRSEVEAHACDWRPCYADGYEPAGDEAFMVTEYGGIAFTNIGLQGSAGGMETWGYHDKVTDEEAFFARYAGVTDAIRAIPYCQGYCYTQLTDVMQEINGLLTPDRRPKVDIDRFRRINRNPDGKTNQVI